MGMVYTSSMKNVRFHYRTSFLSETIMDAHVSSDVLGDMLRKNHMLNRYSSEDAIEHLERVSILKIGKEWKISEILKKSKQIIEILEISII